MVVLRRTLFKKSESFGRELAKGLVVGGSVATTIWPTKRLSVASLHLDAKNPRLGRETTARAPREVIQYLFDHDKALEVALSIAAQGFFPNEPLLAVWEDNRLVVVEGNRRLAALKALREPGLLEGTKRSQVERLNRRMLDTEIIASVPVTVAPSRRATDRQIATRHVGTPVLAWEAENRASFILDKLAEGYSNDELRDDLGFTLSDVQKARQTRAIADMVRSLALPEEVKAKLDSPRVNVFTTIGRVVDSSVGREYLRVEPDAEHGLRGTTTSGEFVRGFTKLVTDVVLQKQSSRTLNKNEDIKKYFDNLKPEERVGAKRGTFVPSDIIRGRSVASQSPATKTQAKPRKGKSKTTTVLPRDFRVRFGTERLADIRNELTKLKRENFPNAGAVLLRVFFELSIEHYLQRCGELQKIADDLKSKNKLQHGNPTMRQLMPAITKIAKEKLSEADATKVEKAIRAGSGNLNRSISGVFA